MQMPKPSILLGIGSSDDDDGGDDLADVLKEMHGHMQTGDYKGAADAMRSAHALLQTDSTPGDDTETY